MMMHGHGNVKVCGCVRPTVDIVPLYYKYEKFIKEKSQYKQVPKSMKHSLS